MSNLSVRMLAAANTIDEFNERFTVQTPWTGDSLRAEALVVAAEEREAAL